MFVMWHRNVSFATEYDVNVCLVAFNSCLYRFMTMLYEEK